MSHKLRILIVGYFPFPTGSAASSRIRTLAKGLMRCGAECRILSTCRLDDRTSSVRNWQGIDYGSVNYSNSKAGLIFRAVGLICALIRLPFKVCGIFKEEKFDLVYIYSRSSLEAVSLIGAARKHGVAIFTDQVEWFSSEAFKWGRLSLRYYDECLGRALLIKYSDGGAAITRFIQRKYERVNTESILLPSVMDFSDSISSITVNRSNALEEFVVLYAGTCKIGDGFSDVLGALEHVIEAGCPVQLKIIGTDGLSGPSVRYRAEVERNPRLAARVFFMGRVSDDQYMTELGGADCLLLPRPNRQITEAAFPTRLPEFLSTGLPVITTSVPDVPCYLEAGVDAVIVHPNVKGYADGILRVWEDPRFGESVGLSGAKRAKEEFDFMKHSQRLYDFFNDVVVRK